MPARPSRVMESTGPLIAVVDDDRSLRELLAGALRQAGFTVVEGGSGQDAIDLTRNRRPQLLICDVRMPGIDGIGALESITRDNPEIPVLLITAHAAVPDAVHAIQTGAVDYLVKPVDLDRLLDKVEAVLGRAQPSGEMSEPGVVAASPAMQQLIRDLRRVAPTDAAVLITGESGVGKEVIALRLHQNSRRAGGPLVSLNCAALPENLVESQLFGHEKGAFTGADSSRPGDFEHADGGTLFLDEIGELPLALQPKLLRALETHQIRRIGGGKDVHVDVRIVTATNRDLPAETAEGHFREDLLYRINVFTLHLPPLRDRKEDILPLAEHFLETLGYGEKKLAPAAQRVLLKHRWPGNARELRNAIERSAIMARGDLILPSDLPPSVVQASGSTPVPAPDSILVGDMQEIQKRAILEALEATGGNKTRAAELLGISRRSLIYKLREYGL